MGEDLGALLGLSSRSQSFLYKNILVDHDLMTTTTMNAQLQERPVPRPDLEPASAPHLAVTHIVPPKGWQLINATELWRFRELIGFLIWRTSRSGTSRRFWVRRGRSCNRS